MSGEGWRGGDAVKEQIKDVLQSVEGSCEV